MSFALEIEEFVQKAGARADEAVKGIVSDAVRYVDKYSPVGDPTTWKHPAPKGYVGGRFKANNQLGIDVQATGTIAAPDTAPAGVPGKTVAANLGRIPDEAAGHVYWITNNLPYARAVEYEGWPGGRGPYAPYGLAFRDLAVIVERAVEAAKARVP